MGLFDWFFGRRNKKQKDDVSKYIDTLTQNVKSKPTRLDKMRKLGKRFYSRNQKMRVQKNGVYGYVDWNRNSDWFDSAVFWFIIFDNGQIERCRIDELKYEDNRNDYIEVDKDINEFNDDSINEVVDDRTSSIQGFGESPESIDDRKSTSYDSGVDYSSTDSSSDSCSSFGGSSDCGGGID